MGKLIKFGAVVGLTCVAVLLVYGYVVDMAPAPAAQSIDVILNGN